MKTNTRLKIVLTLAFFALFFFCKMARAVSVTNYDSIISLATNVTKNYTFTDSSSGQSVTIAVTMTPYSSSNASPTFSLLDMDGDGNYTHMGVDSGLNSGDGNWVENFEGVNFSASLVSASSGVAADSIGFGISGMGVRLDAGSPAMLEWISSATTASFTATADGLINLDSSTASLNGIAYSAQLRTRDDAIYQINDAGALAGQSIALNATFTATNVSSSDPRLTSWFTTDSGKYARIYTNTAMLNNGTPLTTWNNGSQTQSLPAYCGIQEIYSSTNWIYVRSTGLASYNMGPWFLNAQHTQPFPNLPLNQKLLFRFPRTNSVPTTKVLNGGGQIGIFVDGVEMFNSWDGYYWNGSADVQTGGDEGYWNRDAFVNEGVTFDAGYAHQQNTGVFHYHADPLALRYELGDHVDYDPATKTYYEDTNAPTKHSPILAWTADGFPLYGPYGYSNATNANSGIRRMVSGYVARNGLNGTDNLSTNGAARSTIPAWAQRIFGVSADQTGPTVSTSYPFGRYMEDNAYLGDLTNSVTGTNYQQGVDFDLDEYNGRWCVTPEFPNGTYAYFVAINSNGTPVFPYDIGRAFYGDPVGGAVSTISETVVTNFLGGTNLTSTLNSPVVKNGTVTLTWSAIEGGSYQLDATTNLADSSSWTVVGSDISPNQIIGGYTNTTSLDKQFYRVARTSVANFDSAGNTIFSTSSVAPGGNANRSSTVTIIITLPSDPPNPPANAPITSVTLAGSINGANILDATQGTVVATFTIPADAPTGAQNVVVTFQSGPTYTLTGGFTIN